MNRIPSSNANVGPPVIERLDMRGLQSPSPVRQLDGGARVVPALGTDDESLLELNDIDSELLRRNQVVMSESSDRSTLVDATSLTDMSLCESTVSVGSVTHMITAATRDDGTIDHVKLKTAIKDEQRVVRAKFKEERARRKTLEQMVLRLAQPAAAAARLEANPYANVAVARPLAPPPLAARTPDYNFRPIPRDNDPTPIHRRFVADRQASSSGTPLRSAPTTADENYYKATSLFTGDRARDDDGWWWVSARGGEVDEQVKLEHYNTFAKRCEWRQQRVRAAAVDRRQWASEQRVIARNLLIGRLSATEADTQLASLYARPMPEAFPRRLMQRSSKMKYERLPEVLAKVKADERLVERATNRLCAQIYRQRIATFTKRNGHRKK